MRYAAWNVAAIVCLLMPQAGVAQSPPPNVLWICTDDHASYVAGCYGNSVVRTPNIDRLAASGMRFDRAFCNAPVCTASRQSFITGRYPRTVGRTCRVRPTTDNPLRISPAPATAGLTSD